MATITKRELVMKVSNETGLTQQQVFDVVQRTLDTIIEALAAGDSVMMRNFGAFYVRERKAKVGRNPKSPDKNLAIQPRAVVKFKPGLEMKEKVRAVLPVLLER
jgi:nucleoid DNA-binding protein